MKRILPTRRTADAATAAGVAARFDRGDDGFDYYGGVVVGPETIGALALEPATLERVLDVLARLEQDDYSGYVRRFVESGRERAGAAWRYADILTVLSAAGRLLAPERYLEIGVRRGRSMAVLADAAPACSLLGLDLWQEGYAGMDNPGPELVRTELAKVGHRGDVELVSGNSHELLPRLFSDRPELDFDVVTVDGDHSRAGAAQDLRDVLPRLRIGGALVFDDVRHPAHPDLNEAWHEVVEADRRYATWRFDGIGYGVALAVRRW